MDSKKIRNYAKLIARVGINVQPTQEVDIVSPVDQYPFVRILVEELYKAGAAYINMKWSDAPITKLNIEYALFDRLAHLTSYEKEEYEYKIKVHPARIYIDSEDPDALKGIDQVKYGKIIASKGVEIREYRDKYDDYCQWCIAGVPSKEWARKVFPNLKEDDAVEALWEAILKVSRAYEGNPIENWKIHNENLVRHAELLNKLKLKKLHYYSSNGTDLNIELLDNVKWLAGGEFTKGRKIYFQPNIPTEECFTTPNRNKTNGVVYASKPLSYRGEIIENFFFRFENGKVVEVKAEKGEELLKDMIKLDENACYLGECALVPFHSPINDTGILFFSTLYDENAACHLALGDGFSNLIEEDNNYSKDELINMGINQSIVHTDFMIGSSDLNIDGEDKDGKIHHIFVNGDWGEEFK